METPNKLFKMEFSDRAFTDFMVTIGLVGAAFVVACLLSIVAVCTYYSSLPHGTRCTSVTTTTGLNSTTTTNCESQNVNYRFTVSDFKK